MSDQGGCEAIAPFGRTERDSLFSPLPGGDRIALCGRLEADPDDPASLVNPALVVEVLSDSSEDYERGEKLDHYRQIDSLRGVLLLCSRPSHAGVDRVSFACGVSGG